jgi:hypothetical protein
MKETATGIVGADLKTAAGILKTAADVLRYLPLIQADPETKLALYESARLTVEGIRVALIDVTTRLKLLEASWH